ncbi:MAG: FAD:protein FMN transferase [Acidobacteria bacterium]|nr:FAD:protein FMN transferase [Acidobacteriota bacterium]
MQSFLFRQRICLIPVGCMVLALLLAGCGPPPVHVMTRQYMATFFTITIAHDEVDPGVFEAAFARIARVEELMSVYRPDSQVAAINRQAGIAPVTVDSEVLDVIILAAEISRRSNGRFDITYASVHDGCSYRDIRLDEHLSTVFLPYTGMRIDLGAIAKGYAVDLAGRYLQQRGITRFIVNGGGDMLVMGDRYGTPWSVGIQDPTERGKLLHTLAVRRPLAIATSGDYEQPDHIRNPLTRQPAHGLRAVTVIAPTAAEADGYATAIFVLGSEQGLALAREHPTLEVLLMGEGNAEITSEKFWEYFR